MLSADLTKAPLDVLVKYAGYQSLIRNAFGKRALLQPAQISGGQPDIDPRVLPGHGIRGTEPRVIIIWTELAAAMAAQEAQ